MSSGNYGKPGLRVLALDGGDSRCMSQLYILQDFMNRVQRADGQKSGRPCDYFDLIVAVDGSAPLAVLLGVCGMTVEEAQDAYFKLYTDVFLSSDDKSSNARGEYMESALKETLQRLGIPETTKFSDPILHRYKSKVALCYASAVHLGVCRMFRNYEHPPQSDREPTIIQAIRSAWATPGHISPALVGPEGREEMLMSAKFGFNNPTQEAMREAFAVFGSAATVSCLLSLGAGQLGVISLDQQGEATHGLSTQMVSDSEGVAEAVHKHIGNLRVYFRFTVDRGLENWDEGRKDFGVLKSHTDAYISKEQVNTALDGCLRACQIPSNITTERLCRSRAKARGTSHGLPPLSAYFVMRRQPMEDLVESLIGNDASDGQRVVVLSGLGGNGKTQLVLKFAMDHEDSFEHILFIDASSSESIEKGLIARVRAMGVEYACETVEEALHVLAHPDEVITEHWLVIFDNADDVNVNLPDYFPNCRHGSILITSRNPIMGNLATSHIELDVMQSEEAVEALLSSIYPAKTPGMTPMRRKQANSGPSRHDRDVAKGIVEQLGYLPIAIIQAGCYIKQQKCFHDYSRRLKENPSKLLEYPTRFHRDKLRYPHSVYSAFDITLEVLTPRARKLLGILSFGHFSDFPRPLFSIAAKSKPQFSTEPFDLTDRTSEFTDAIQLLKEVLLPNEVWEEEQLDRLLEELQQYSLVTLTPINSVVTLRFHPLIHSWIKDRLDPQEQAPYKAAAIRLLTCGLEWENEYIFDFLSRQVDTFLPTLSTLHLNDQAAFSRTLLHNDKSSLRLEVLTRIHKEVEAAHGEMNVRTTRALLELADARGHAGDRAAMEKMEREAVRRREMLLGGEDIETAKAQENLARTLRGNKHYKDAETLAKTVIRTRIKALGIWHNLVATGFIELGRIYQNTGRYQDCQVLMETAVTIRTKLFGRADGRTIGALELLVICHAAQGHEAEDLKIQEEIWELRKAHFGEQHLATVRAMSFLVRTYREQRRFKEAEVLHEAELEARRTIQGEHMDTLDAMAELAETFLEQKRYKEAEELAHQILDAEERIGGGKTGDRIEAMCLLGSICYNQQRYQEAEQWYIRELEVRQAHPIVDCDERDFMWWIGRCCFEQYRYVDAEKWWRLEIAERQRDGGEDSIYTMTAKRWLGRSLIEQKRCSEAYEHLSAELVGRRKVHGENHISTLYSSYYNGRALYELGRLDEAEQLWRQGMKTRQALLGEHDTDAIYIPFWLGRVLEDMKQYDEAETLWKGVLVDMKSLKDRPDKLTARTLGHLSLLYHVHGRDKEAQDTAKQAQEALDKMRQAVKSNDPLLELTMELIKKVKAKVKEPGETLLINGSEVANVAPQSGPVVAASASDEISAPDPGGNPADSLHISVQPLAPSRPRSPFEMRAKFGALPNSWSMF